MELTIKNLENCFNEAVKKDVNYVGVKVEVKGFERPEIILNQRGNFESKLKYYKEAYDEDLTLKGYSGVRIVGFAYANTFREIEETLFKIKE